MSHSPAWIAANRPSEREFMELCRAAQTACERGLYAFDIERISDPERVERHVIEEITFAIEKVLDAAHDLNKALTASLAGALPVERVVDAAVVEAGPF